VKGIKPGGESLILYPVKILSVVNCTCYEKPIKPLFSRIIPYMARSGSPICEVIRKVLCRQVAHPVGKGIEPLKKTK